MFTIEQGANKVSVPTFNAWHAGWGHAIERPVPSRAWETRTPQLVWRGDASGYGPGTPRRRLLRVAARHADLIDAADTGGAYGKAHHMSMRDQMAAMQKKLDELGK